MRVLLLGPKRKNCIDFLISYGDEIVICEEPITKNFIAIQEIDFIVSYGYRHIVQKDILNIFPKRAINLHISLLPWNRGSDPNLWSFLEDSPKGVTIHYMDEGLDTGDILIQQSVTVASEDTLRTSYARLSRTIERLFMESWSAIRKGDMPASPQPKDGTSHGLRDRKKYVHLLTKGWDTPVKQLIGRAL